MKNTHEKKLAVTRALLLGDLAQDDLRTRRSNAKSATSKPRKLAAEDRAPAKRIRRSDDAVVGAILRELLVRHFDLLSDTKEKPEKKAALSYARKLGEAWARRNADKTTVTFDDYFFAAVEQAWQANVMNDVERALWFHGPKDDPRVLEFIRGFYSVRKAKKNNRRGK